MKKVNLLIVLGMVTGAGFAQDTLTISKNDLLQKVTENNLQIKVAEKSFQSAKADYRQSNALFLPNINVSHTGISTTNPLMAFGSKLNQEKNPCITKALWGIWAQLVSHQRVTD